MRKLQGFVCVGLLMGFSAYASQPATQPSLTPQQQLSYAMGAMAGKAFKEHGVALDPTTFASGLSDAMNGKPLQMTDAEMRTVLASFDKQERAKMTAAMAADAAKNEASGSQFLTENAKKAGVHTTKSGLEYRVITPGQGAHPGATSTVTVDYEGRLVNGTVFDSSYKRGEPATFALDAVIPGWQEALQLMQPGATWEIVIPPQLAYGKNGVPGAIPPNATLIFKVHLISVAPPAKKS